MNYNLAGEITSVESETYDLTSHPYAYRLFHYVYKAYRLFHYVYVK